MRVCRNAMGCFVRSPTDAGSLKAGSVSALVSTILGETRRHRLALRGRSHFRRSPSTPSTSFATAEPRLASAAMRACIVRKGGCETPRTSVSSTLVTKWGPA